jgi:hypothetical protein
MPTLQSFILSQVSWEPSMEVSLYNTCTIQVAEPAISLLLTAYLEAKFSTCIGATISAWVKSGYKPEVHLGTHIQGDLHQGTSAQT